MFSYIKLAIFPYSIIKFHIIYLRVYTKFQSGHLWVLLYNTSKGLKQANLIHKPR
jgi:hypothetical protein